MIADTFSENSLAALADALTDPGRIANARREQQRRRDTEAAQARDAALKKLPILQAAQAAAENQLATALQELRFAEAAAERHRGNVLKADEAVRAAAADVARLHRELSFVHGGAAVEMALARLGLAIAAQRQKIENLEEAQWDRRYAADGVTVVWRSLKPDQAAKVRPAKDHLRELESAQGSILGLVQISGQSPSAIQRKAVEALEGLGVPCDDLLGQPSAR